MIKETETSADISHTPIQRGRKSTGMPRAEIEKAASEKHRKKLIQSGKSELKAFVDPKTKLALMEMKIKLDLRTIGEVIDVLTQRYKDISEKS